MTISNKCLIDNWSLEQAACLFETDSLETFPTEELFINSLGGLSNFINALLLYDETKFIANGYQTGWYSYKLFKENATLYLKPYLPDDNYIYFNRTLERIEKENTYVLGDDYLSDFLSIYERPLMSKNNLITNDTTGTNYYLLTSKYLESDLFISPYRATQILNQPPPMIDNILIDILEKIDHDIQIEKSKICAKKLQVGIEQNFILPSLTQFVFSQASSLDDLFKVIMQMKVSNKITNLKNEIQNLTESTRDFTKFQIEIENKVKECFSIPNKSEKNWSIKINVLFLTVTKSFNLEFVNRKQYSTLLNDMITCRTETLRLKKDIERLFNRRINIQ